MTYSSLRQRIDDLPEPDRSIRRALYSDEEWSNSWELTAWDHQLPPRDDEWRVWTLVGPPRTGKTEAGLRWVQDHFFTPTSKRIAVVYGYSYTAEECLNKFMSFAGTVGLAGQMSWDRERGIAHPSLGKVVFCQEIGSYSHRTLQGAQFDYVWGDDVMDAKQVIRASSSAKQHVFTQPLTLPHDTLLSKPKELT